MRETRRTLVEAVAIVAISLVLGLGVNAVNEDGLKLSRNYFERLAKVTTQPAGVQAGADSRPGGAVEPGPQPAPAAATAAGSSAVGPAAVSPAARRLLEAGVGIAHLDDVKTMLESPVYGSMEVLIDARDDRHYQAGHIPGAYQLDHYHVDRYLPALLPVVFPADRVIIYCAGGECEDSELAAMDLIRSGVDRSRIFVYLEGYKEWASRGEPVEKGERGSGDIAPGTAQ